MAELTFYVGLVWLFYTAFCVWTSSGDVKKDMPLYPGLLMAAGVAMKLVFHVA